MTESSPALNRYNELTAAQRVYVDRLINAIASTSTDVANILHVATNAVHDQTRRVTNR